MGVKNGQAGNGGIRNWLGGQGATNAMGRGGIGALGIALMRRGMGIPMQGQPQAQPAHQPPVTPMGQPQMQPPSMPWMPANPNASGMSDASRANRLIRGGI